MVKYIVTAFVKGKKEQITIPLTLQKAKTRVINLRREMKFSIPKYKWATKIGIEKQNLKWQ